MAKGRDEIETLTIVGLTKVLVEYQLCLGRKRFDEELLTAFVKSAVLIEFGERGGGFGGRQRWGMKRGQRKDWLGIVIVIGR